jgi:hypothetical protein
MNEVKFCYVLCYGRVRKFMKDLGFPLFILQCHLS